MSEHTTGAIRAWEPCEVGSVRGLGQVGSGLTCPRTFRPGTRNTSGGFSLFELLIVLVIVGIVAGVSLHAFFFAPASLSDAAQTVVREVESARSQALLTHRPVILQLSDTSIAVTTTGEKQAKKTQLPESVHVFSVNDMPAADQTLKLVFHPQGIVQESLIVLESRPRDGSMRKATVYVPSVGSAVIFEGHKDFDHLMKELL